MLDSVGLQELHRELLRKSMGDNDSNEVLTIVNVNDYNQKVITFGSERSVMPSKNIEALTMMQKSKYQSVYWLHNHGFTNEFSYNDLGCFYDERIKALTIVTNKGKIAVMNKTKKYSVQKFRDIIIEERGKYENPIDHSDEIAKAILRRHNECGDSVDKVMNMEPNRPLIIPKELMSPDAETKKNWDLFDDMLKQTEELIKSGKLD